MKDDLAYIEHILLSISKIKDFMENMTRSDFEKNEMVQDAVIRKPPARLQKRWCAA